MRGPRGLRWLAWLLVRGAGDRFIRVEMEEADARDIACGMSA